MSSPVTAQRPPAAPPLIAVDAMGGDHAPREIVAGAVRAVREHGLRLALVGRSSELAPLVAAEQAARELPIVHAEEALAMHEGALAAWRRARPCRGGLQTGPAGHRRCPHLRHYRRSGLHRHGPPAYAPWRAPSRACLLLPHPHTDVLLDAGANADAKPEMLVQFAHLGAAYARVGHGIAEPQWHPHIGSEPGKATN